MTLATFTPLHHFITPTGAE